MKKVLNETKVFWKGNSQVIPAGTTYPDDAEIVLANPTLFVTVEVAKAPKKAAKVELKEELLVEAPVAAVTIEVVEEPVEEVATETRKSRKRK